MKAGNYETKTVVKDDDGGVWQGIQQVTVMNPPAGGGSATIGVESDDATLHSLLAGGPLQQADPGYAGVGFTPNCLNYTMAAALATPITVTADAGAVITYTSGGGPSTILPQDTLTMVNLPLTITVTAEDGVTTRQYTITP